jgi:hypothetical protein
MTTTRNRQAGATPELGLVRFLPIQLIKPSPENDKLYRPVDPADPEIRALAKSIKAHGVKEPLVITQDHFILSGHRRYVAAKLAGLIEVPCRYEDITRDDPRFLPLLREYNRQREKTDAEKLREEVVSANPEEAYRALREHRKQQARVEVSGIQIKGVKERAQISEAKRPFLNAAITVINALQEFWPLSVRQIHYALLNDPPLLHAGKPDSIYRNHINCYKSLSELLTRARLEGYIPMDVIADETRPVVLAVGYETTTPFLRAELNDFLKGYYRNLQQTQPNHIEIIGEKNTVLSVLRPVAADYSVPLTIGRGYSSLPPRYQMAQRFQNSGKEKLILLALSDFDPDGEEIAHSFARSMRDDFGIQTILPIKVALTAEHVARFQLVPQMQAKESSANYTKFVGEHGRDVYELEAVPPATLQILLREAIDEVLDIDAYNVQVDKEKEDAAYLDGARRQVHAVLRNERFGEEPESKSD